MCSGDIDAYNRKKWLRIHAFNNVRFELQVSLWRILGLKTSAKKLEGSYSQKFWLVIP